MADEYRTDGFCAIEINMWPGRTEEAKTDLIEAICNVLVDKFDVARKDICVIIREVHETDLFYI